MPGVLAQVVGLLRKSKPEQAATVSLSNSALAGPMLERHTLPLA